MSAAAQSAKDAALAKCWAIVNQPSRTARQGLPQKTWTDMDERTRTVLAMLGGTGMEDPRQVARRPWAALSDEDRAGIGAVARALNRQLKYAHCLF